MDSKEVSVEIQVNQQDENHSYDGEAKSFSETSQTQKDEQMQVNLNDEVSEGAANPLSSKPYNEALVRWALHRVTKDINSINSYQQRKLWLPISWFVLGFFLTLFALGLWKLQYNYLHNSYSNVDLTFHCVCLIIYIVTFIRGIIIFRKPTTVWIISTYEKFSGQEQNGQYTQVMMTTDGNITD